MRIDYIRHIAALLILLFSSTVIRATVPERYDKHIIVAVDQTIVGNPRMVDMYYALSSLLRNERSVFEKENFNVPENFSFNPEKDEVSLYSFCLPGSARQQILSDRQGGGSLLTIFLKNSYIALSARMETSIPPA